MSAEEQTNQKIESVDLARVIAVLAEYQGRRAAGEIESEETLLAAYPELMPELGEELRKLRLIAGARQMAANDDRTAAVSGLDEVSSDHNRSQTDQSTRRHSDSESGHLEVRCPSCHSPTEIAVDTPLTDLTCTACGSHFSLVDQSQATRMAPSLSKLGRFELIERIGVGGFGSVWKARDKQLDRTVAVKVPRQGFMSAEEAEKFFREARAAAQLKHPNIVSVHEVGRDGDSVYIVSDFVRGVTLGDWLTGQRPTSREAAELCAQIADALQHAHEQGVVHRDLKPANIMMDGNGQPHLMDFGLARREVGEITVTMDGQVLGTPAYMSPEQAQGEGHTADRRSDVYSLGVILFQLLTSELPFRGNARMLVHQVINEPAPSPRKFNGNVPKDLETITLKCLEKYPTNRYQSAHDLGDELRRFLVGEPILARPVSRVQRVWRWCNREPLLAGMSGTLAALSLVAISVLILSNARIRQESRAKDAALQRATAEAAKATTISDLLQEMLRKASPDSAHGSEYTVRMLLDDFSMDLGDRLRGQPETEAAVRAILGNAYRSLEQFGQAEHHLEQALAIRERVFGSVHVDVASSLQDQAMFLMDQGDLEAAESQADRALAIHRQLGLRTIEAIRSLTLLQMIYERQKRYEDSEKVGVEALMIAKEQPDSHSEVPSILHRLATTAWYRDDLPRAEKLLLESIPLHRKINGPSHPQTAWALHLMGCLLEAEEHYDEAEVYFREAMTIFSKHFDETSRGWLFAVSHLENVLEAQKDERGLAALRDEVATRATLTLQRRPGDTRVMNAAMQALTAVGDVEGALKVYAAAIENTELADSKSASVLTNLGIVLASEGDWKRAADVFSSAAKLETDTVDSVSVHYYLALVQLQLGNQQHYKDTCIAVMESPHLSAEDLRNLQLWTYCLSSNAIPDFREPLRMAEELVKNNPDDADYLCTLGGLLYRSGQYKKAAQQLEQSISILANKTSDPSAILRPHLLLAMTTWHLSKQSEARELIAKTLPEVDQAIDTRSTSWTRRAILQLFRREAKTLILQDNANEGSSKRSDLVPGPMADKGQSKP